MKVRSKIYAWKRNVQHGTNGVSGLPVPQLAVTVYRSGRDLATVASVLVSVSYELLGSSNLRLSYHQVTSAKVVDRNFNYSSIYLIAFFDSFLIFF